MVRWTFNLLGWANQASYLGFLFAIICAAPVAAPAQRVAWTTGDALVKQLELPVEIHWQDVILNEAVQRLATAHRVAIMLDRRIDPHQTITTSFTQTRLIDAIHSICESHGWGVSIMSPVLYIGPTPTTEPLLTWYRLQSSAIDRLDAASRLRWQRVSPCAWGEVTEPRLLVDDWLRRAGITAEGLDQIPYDLWAGQDLPPLNLLQRLTLGLAGFQLAPQVNSDAGLQIVPLPEHATVRHTYVVPPQRLATLGQLDAELSQAQVRRRQQLLDVIGRAEDHDRVQAWLLGRPRRVSPGPGSVANKRFTLTVQNQPIDAILHAIAQQLDLELVWPDSSDSWRRERVSVKVENATIGEVMATVLQGRAAGYHLQGKKLVITLTE